MQNTSKYSKHSEHSEHSNHSDHSTNFDNFEQYSHNFAQIQSEFLQKNHNKKLCYSWATHIVADATICFAANRGRGGDGEGQSSAQTDNPANTFGLVGF